MSRSNSSSGPSQLPYKIVVHLVEKDRIHGSMTIPKSKATADKRGARER